MVIVSRAVLTFPELEWIDVQSTVLGLITQKSKECINTSEFIVQSEKYYPFLFPFCFPIFVVLL